MQNQKTTQRIIALVAAELFGKPIDTQLFEGMDYAQWKELFEVSSPHSQSAIALDGMKYLSKELHPSSTFMIAWEMDTRRREKEYDKRAKTLEQLAALFHRGGIEKVMVLKGIGTASFYPTPSHRFFEDIDIFLFGQWQQADDIIRKEFGKEAVHESKYHNQTKYDIHNILVENHRLFLSSVTHKLNKQYEAILQELVLKETSNITLGSEIIFLPPPEFNALFLLRHASTHFSSCKGLEIRQICDWGMFLSKNSDKVDWTKAETVFRDHNVYLFYSVLNTILTLYFGYKASSLPPFKMEKELAQKVLDDIMEDRLESNENNLFNRVKKAIKDRWKHKLIYSGGFFQTLIRRAWFYIKTR